MMGVSGQPSNPPNTNGGSNPSYNNVTFNDKTSCRWSLLRCVVLTLAVLFLVTAIIFIVLFAIFYTRYKDEESAAKSVCSTPDCVLAAARMVKKMNVSADPCKDFHEYACGRFLRETIIPEGKGQVSKFTVLKDENELIMKDIVVQDITQTEPQYLSNMKRFYISCIDEDQIETVGLDPYIKDTFVNDWPTLNPRWTEASFNLKKLIARYAKVYIDPIFSHSGNKDLMDSKKKVLYLSNGDLGLSKEQFDKPRNDSVIMAYQTYLAEMAVAVNANRTIAEQDARDVVDLEIALSQIMLPTKEEFEFKQRYNPVQLANLSRMYPELDIPGAIRAAFTTANIALPDDERVINMYPTYIGNISSVVQRFYKRTIQNLFGFKYALSRVENLTKRMRDIRFKFDKVLTNVSVESPLREFCVKSSSKVFSKGMGKQFVQRTFPETAKRYMEEMIINLKAEFKKMVEENTWISQTTKDKALIKLAAMRLKIGYPDANFTDADIDRFYENYNMSKDNYYNNRVLHYNLDKIDTFRSLKTPMDRNEWSADNELYVVNAYNAHTQNEIIFPAAILRAPVFSESFQDYMNYAAIGAIIGHEITHGFDNFGSQFDEEGIPRDWWAPKDHKIFLKKIQCIVAQNNNFRVDEINMTLNGNTTQGESVSDNGGVKESFRAYKQLVLKKGEQPRLPGLKLTQDQLFFLAYGQLWCEKSTNQEFIREVTRNLHPPGKFRIIGPLQNSPEFAKAYNCPLGSYMNPVKKCEVW